MRRGKGKKILLILIIWVIIGVVLSIIAKNKQKDEQEAEEKKIKEAAEKMDKEITSGQFVLDGVVYKFPMDLQDWLDNGWHVSNNYENKDDFTLEPGATSNEFELFNEDDDYVRVSVINTTQEDAKLEDCMVYSLYMSLTEVDVIFPSGINKSSKPDEVLEAYGEPESEGDEDGLLEALYYYESDDAWKCFVELNVYDNDYTIDPLSNVEYSIESFGSIIDSLVSEEGMDGTYEIFIDASMKTSYWGDYTEYLEYGIDSESNAQALYESEVVYFAESLMYYADIYADYADEETLERIYQISRDVLAKVKWEIKDIEIDTFGEGTLTIDIYPTDFFYVIEDDIYAAVEDYNTKYADVDFDNVSDEEYLVMEQYYIESVVSAMEQKVAEAGTLDAVEKEYEIDTNDTILSDESWFDIDDTIMNLVE